MRKLIVLFLAIAPALLAQERKIDPTWLHRDVATLQENPTDLTTATCHYTPIFGEGDSQAQVPLTITRFGNLTIDPHGSCQTITYPQLEELYFVQEGSAQLRYNSESGALTANDFTYIAPAAAHTLTNLSEKPVRLILTTVKVAVRQSPASSPTPSPAPSPAAQLQIANLSELHEQIVGGHPSSVLYKLLIGPHTGTRDRINATFTVADFFLMDFAPGGTNHPHHHEVAEEIYLVLDGEGNMAAGSGTDGIQGLHPAKSGDAYYFRPNCTVGFYNQNAPNAKAHILAVRSVVPMPKNAD
jgi:mannose-6-phosphate isomerase-like protein (cupin superfamily)